MPASADWTSVSGDQRLIEPPTATHVAEPQTAKSAWHSPAVVGLAYFVLSMFDSGRTYGHDGATSITFNIADRPWSDALGGEAIYSNHPVASVFGQLIWRLGGTTEVWQRLPSALAAAALVALVFWFTRTRFGVAAAVSASLILASTPIFLSAARTVRGYALMLCFVSFGTVILLRIVNIEKRQLSPPTRDVVAFILLMGLGIGSHAYGGMILLCQIGFLFASRVNAKAWIERTVWSLLIAALAYMVLLPSLLAGRGRVFRPNFPLVLARDLGGGHWVAGLAISGLFIAYLVSNRKRPEIRMPAIVGLGIVALMWLVLAPFDLYPRFFLSFLPAMAIGVAAQTRRFGWLATAAVGGAMAISVVGAWSHLTDDLESREVAALAAEVTNQGGKACGIGWTSFGVLPYSDVIEPLVSLEELRKCNLIVTYVDREDWVLEEIKDDLPHSGVLVPGSLYLLAWSDEFDSEVETFRAQVAESSP